MSDGTVDSTKTKGYVLVWPSWFLCPDFQQAQTAEKERVGFYLIFIFRRSSCLG
jgi:hypothetical protein